MKIISVEEYLSEKFKSYKKDEEALFSIKKNKFVKRGTFFFSILFLFCLVFGEFLLIKASEAINTSQISHYQEAVEKGTAAKNEDGTVYTYGESNYSVEPMFFLICIVILGFPILSLILIYLWFYGDDGIHFISKIENDLDDFYINKGKENRIEKERKEREEFLKLYELYSSDDDFREAYNASFSKKQEKEDFLNKVKGVV